MNAFGNLAHDESIVVCTRCKSVDKFEAITTDELECDITLHDVILVRSHSTKLITPFDDSDPARRLEYAPRLDECCAFAGKLKQEVGNEYEVNCPVGNL